MKILHFTLGKANPDNANGINKVINGICKYCNKTGNARLEVLGWSKTQESPYMVIERNGFIVHCYNSFRGVIEFIKNRIHEYDVVHMHNTWNYTNDRVVRILRKKNIPYVISVHASLCHDRLKRRNFFLKYAYHKLVQSKTLKNASAIQATTYEEQLDIRKFTAAPIFVLPNGIDLEEHEIIRRDQQFKCCEKSEAIFVGRFAKEKNIEGLIKAISILPDEYRQSFRLNLIGPVTEIAENMVLQLDLQKQVVFHGSKFGKERQDLMDQADFYIHPAFSDACPVALVGAMASGLPAVVTRTSYVSYFYNSGAFVMVEPISEDIARGIIEMIDNKKSWSTMSLNAQKLVEEQLNWRDISNKMIEVYRKCLV